MILSFGARKILDNGTQQKKKKVIKIDKKEEE